MVKGKRQLFFCSGSEPLSCLQGPLGHESSHYTFTRGFSWTWPGPGSHACDSQDKIKIAQFPGPCSPESPDGSDRTGNLWQTTWGDWRVPSLQGANIQSRKEAFSIYDHSEVSKWCWQENEIHQSSWNKKAFQSAPRCRVNFNWLDSGFFCLCMVLIVPQITHLALRPTWNNSAFSHLRLEPEGKARFKLLTDIYNINISTFNLMFTLGLDIFTPVYYKKWVH